jgi:hypothetical protein
VRNNDQMQCQPAEAAALKSTPGSVITRRQASPSSFGAQDAAQLLKRAPIMAGMNEQTPHMPNSEWDEVCRETTQAMAAYVPQFMTPISHEITDAEGRLEGELDGTGSYLNIGNATFLLTNEHVAARLAQWRLCHMFNGSDQVFAVRGNFASVSQPVDAAIARVDMTNEAAAAGAVPLSLYANSHQAIEGELLFIAGYPGQRSAFWYGTLISPLTPYLTQEDVEQSKVLDARHFAVPWLPDRARSVSSGSPGLSLPPGMSGSLVWNTRRVEFHQSDQPWSPQEARVTGLVFSWSTCKNWVYATKVEYLRSAFPKMIAALDTSSP